MTLSSCGVAMRPALVLVIGTVATLAPTAPPAQAATVDTAAGYVVVARHSGKVVDIASASTANGANVVQWTDRAGRLTGVAWHINEAGVNLPNEMKTVARAQSTPLIDLTALSATLVQQLGVTASQQLFLSREKGDSTHFSEYGAATMSNLVLDEAVRLNVIRSTQVR